MNKGMVFRNTALAIGLSFSAAAQAGPIATGSWYGFCFGPSGSGASDGCSNDAGQSSGNAFSFLLLSPMELRVTDAFQKGDTFNVFDGGSFLFHTSVVPVDGGGTVTNPDTAFADSTYSHGSTVLGAGAHSIDIFVDDSPFGGGGAYVSVMAAIPEPETYAMLLAGLGLMGFMARRRKQKMLAA